MDFILPTLVCQDLDIRVSTLDNTIHPSLVMKPEEETIFSKEWRGDGRVAHFCGLSPPGTICLLGSPAHINLIFPFNRKDSEFHAKHY